ncbi:MAG: hypothetical protein WC791_02120 [Candidatus Paceibacterota bacterium]|jgi:hypothetical protein
MKGAVPQKGLKMPLKLTINQGPFSGDSNMGFMISVDHCQEISNYLFKWYKTIPEAVTNHIEVIVVSPHRAPTGEFVSIRIICSCGGKMQWKKQADLLLFHFSTRENLLVDHPKLDLQLNWQLDKALRDEKESREFSVSYLNGLLGSMDKMKKSML